MPIYDVSAAQRILAEMDQAAEPDVFDRERGEAANLLLAELVALQQHSATARIAAVGRGIVQLSRRGRAVGVRWDHQQRSFVAATTGRDPIAVPVTFDPILRRFVGRETGRRHPQTDEVIRTDAIVEILVVAGPLLLLPPA